MPLKGGNRGEWSDVRPRRGKTPEQVDNRRDRLREDQQHGGARRHRQSRVRARYESPWRDYDSEDSRDFCEPILSNDGRVIMQYSRHDMLAGAAHKKNGRSRLHEVRSPGPVRRSKSRRRFYSRDVFGYGDEDRDNQQRRKFVITAGHEYQDEENAGGAVSKIAKDIRQWPHQTSDPGTVKHNVVSFYFTNVSDNISYNSLRHGFEVCGIMEDVYLARKRNVNGANFGFVRYSKVKDVDKLLKAVNNVWFGDYKVVVKVSSYDRYGNKREEEGRKAMGVKTNEGEKNIVVLKERKHDVGGENITEGEKK